MMRILIIVLVFLSGCAPNKDFQWQEGDVLFQGGECGDFCDAIRKVNDGTHLPLTIGNGVCFRLSAWKAKNENSTNPPTFFPITVWGISFSRKFRLPTIS